MDSSINVDHDQLLEFSNYLINEGVAGFEEIKKKIEDELVGIRQNGWNDNKLDEFCDVFQNSKRDIEKICDLLKNYSLYLTQKARKVAEYQSVGFIY